MLIEEAADEGVVTAEAHCMIRSSGWDGREMHGEEAFECFKKLSEGDGSGCS